MIAEPSPEKWAQIRYDYEYTDKPVDDICRDYRVSASTLHERVRRWRWTLRRQPIPLEGPPPPMPPAGYPVPLVPAVAPIGAPACTQPVAALGETTPDAPAPLAFTREEPPPDPAVIVPRLQGAVARVLPAIEATLGKLATGPMAPREMERAARTLTSLTRTLRELNGLLGQYPAPPASDDDAPPADDDEFLRALVRRLDAFAVSRGIGVIAGTAAEPQTAPTPADRAET
jgi:hypothetical protein